MAFEIKIIIPDLAGIAIMEDEPFLRDLLLSARQQRRRLEVYIQALESRLEKGYGAD